MSCIWDSQQFSVAFHTKSFNNKRVLLTLTNCQIGLKSLKRNVSIRKYDCLCCCGGEIAFWSAHVPVEVNKLFNMATKSTVHFIKDQ